MRDWIGRAASDPPVSVPLPHDWGESPGGRLRTCSSMVMQLLAVRHGKSIWCEKTPMHVFHLQLLGNAFPRAKFIHIIRDGRDCAASFHRRWKFNPLRSAFRWKSAVSAGRTQATSLGSRYLEVRYEDMTSAPEDSLCGVCEFLDIPFEESVLVAARARPKMSGTDARVITQNDRSAGHYFYSATIARIERIAGKCLSDLGYHCENTTGDEDPSVWTLRLWRLADDFRRSYGIAFSDGRILHPSSWPYLFGRLQRARRQRSGADPQ